MTFDECVAAVEDFGLTDRQARFLVTVMRHAGVCVPRQYATSWASCTAARTAMRSSTRWSPRVGHCHTGPQSGAALPCPRKALYGAIGQAPSRFRRRGAGPPATERLMLLDAVLTMPHLDWLTTVSEKRAYLASLAAFAAADMTSDGPAEPASGKGPHLPGAFPIGVDADGRTALLFLATEAGTRKLSAIPSGARRAAACRSGVDAPPRVSATAGPLV